MSRADRILIASVASALMLAGAGAWVLLSATPAATVGPAPDVLSPASGAAAASGPPASAGPPPVVVVDVQGAVMEPGVHELAPGSRVADALSAAGGYGADADLDAAAAAINLAAPVVDGQQIMVPRVGAAPARPAATAEQPGGSAHPVAGDGGPVNLNTATADELEALPGVGPVTVEKILAARAERPFTSLEDAVARGVLDRGQLQDIEGLATAG